MLIDVYKRQTQNNNKENIDLSISNLLKIQLSTKYIAQAKHCKYSVSDGLYKIYNHKLPCRMTSKRQNFCWNMDLLMQLSNGENCLKQLLN